MLIQDFQAIVSTFTDPGDEWLWQNNQFVISVNKVTIEAEIIQSMGDVFIKEKDAEAMVASKWILQRLAHIDLLASRIKDQINSNPFFVSPSSVYSPVDSHPVDSNDALAQAKEVINRDTPFETQVLYLTSDAGEGKTSVINQLAHDQAVKYLAGETDRILVPIPLGGRHFLRFDDLTAGVLHNKYRFQFLYYSSFIELVKLGVIIPAFDGFEEMFVETSSGEALSAMSILMNTLCSSGKVLVAARKAYYEFENMRIQERLFDSIDKKLSVRFDKIELKRWQHEQFVSYSAKRGVKNPEVFYREAVRTLGENHALLTRAVLVKNLIDITINANSNEQILQLLNSSGHDFFYTFVQSIIQREAEEKWIDRSGANEIGAPLIELSEHSELLADIAVEMWVSNVAYAKEDILDFVAEYFCELHTKTPFELSQIRKRLPTHAMLVPSTSVGRAVEFDHDEFRFFFLGEGVASLAAKRDKSAVANVRKIFRRDILPIPARESLYRALKRTDLFDGLAYAKFFYDVAGTDVSMSFTHDNCSDIMMRLLHEEKQSTFEIDSITLGADVLKGKMISDVYFRKCFFSSTSLEYASLSNCSFENCRFAQLRIFDTTKFDQVNMISCTVDSIELIKFREGEEIGKDVWDPQDIQAALASRGVSFPSHISDAEKELLAEAYTDSPEVVDIRKILRYLTRSTHIGENIIYQKLGERGRQFVDVILPELLSRGIFTEIKNKGAGDQKRFSLGIPLRELNETIANTRGSYQLLLAEYDQNINA